jgi:hypothetical protein
VDLVGGEHRLLTLTDAASFTGLSASSHPDSSLRRVEEGGHVPACPLRRGMRVCDDRENNEENYALHQQTSS